MSEQVTGGELLQIANASWDERRQRYRGWQYLIAVGKAKAGIEKSFGNRKARKQEAEHQISVLLTHSRHQSVGRLDVICGQAMSASDGFAAGSELTSFAGEVMALLNGHLDAGFGAVDLTMIIGLIVAIVNAIKACKSPVPVPVPTP